MNIANHTTFLNQPLAALPDEIARLARQHRQRPTIRALLFERGHRSRQQVASFRVATSRLERNRGDRVFTTVGGGVEDRMGWIPALQRELQEELQQCHIHRRELQRAVVLAMETIPTSRPTYQHKLVVIVGVPLAHKHFHQGNLAPRGREIQDLFIGSIADQANRLRHFRETPEAMVRLYRQSFSSLREHCSA